MKSAILLALVSTTSVVWVSVAQAQFSIRGLQPSPGISISGEIRSVVGNEFINEFILDDGTRQVIVYAGPRWYRQLNFTVGERVTVIGEYDNEDFDAYKITRNNGDVIQIRPAGGPPPWERGSQR